VYLFNEQYVVKPPSSSSEFAWHRDEDEQLLMCLQKPGMPYVSAWCALDKVNEENGPLVLVPLNAQQEVTRLKTPHPNKCPNILAGTVIFFLSNVWHCSPSNRTDKVRRVFYSQYTQMPLQSGLYFTPASNQVLQENKTSTDQDGQKKQEKKHPLLFAIPCSLA